VLDLIEDVRAGLLSPPRYLPPKYFYDDRGSSLFDLICETPEYYPTRMEDSLLSRYGQDIISRARPGRILELGSGTSRKTRRLLDACEQLAHTCIYTPYDVCEPALEQAATELLSAYPWLEITPLAGDYHAGLGNLPAVEGTTLFVFLGSTIGNFSDAEANAFINEIRQCMQPGDFFLLGADRVKNNAVLHAAYNDLGGLTAAFNLNVLSVLNRELQADFRLDNFAHEAVFNTQFSRIEMYLVSSVQQSIRLGTLAETIVLEPGDRILTEISRKFLYEEVEKLLADSGLTVINHFEPDNGYFSLVLAQLGCS
jgi:L-histidine N-alpha-methyltransferase